MAKRQTRRTVSLSRATYDAIMESSRAAGISASEWLTQLIRVQCPQLTQQIHVRPAREGEPSHAVVPPTAVMHVAAATPAPPRSVFRVPARPAPKGRPGSLCANCVERQATHHGKCDTSGQTYDLCDDCEMPADNVEDGRGRWKRKVA